MNLLGPSWTTFAGSVALALSLGGTAGLFKGISHEKSAQAARVAKQVAVARTLEQATARNTFRLQEVRDADSIRINDRLADALQRLRNRSDQRLSGPTAASCAGATGRELSRFDAEALERLAARADLLRADLATCRGWIEEVTQPARKSSDQ